MAVAAAMEAAPTLCGEGFGAGRAGEGAFREDFSLPRSRLRETRVENNIALLF